jgi:superfamily II DNA or RNA helicase
VKIKRITEIDKPETTYNLHVKSDNHNYIANNQIVSNCHGAKASVLAKLLREHGNHIVYRFGMTGTMPDFELDNLQVRVTLGDVHYEIAAHQLIEQGFLSTINIDVVRMEEEISSNYFPDYAAEMDYLRSYKPRTKWIAKFTYEKSLRTDGNVLMLVSSIPFGKKLCSLIPNAHFVYGADKTSVRKEIYDLFKVEEHVVVITTVQVAGTGLSIDRVFNLMFVDIGKSFVRVIQAIGRGLRKNVKSGKSHCDAYDICSSLKYSKQHLRKRTEYYRDNKYPYKEKKIKYIESDSIDKKI